MRREVELPDGEPWFLAPSGAIEDSLTLQAALLQLPREQREVIVMHVWGQMSFEDVSLVIGVSPNTAASRYRYGLSRLRTLMQTKEVHRNAAGE
jgi:RNA polymerase sigma-70 factor (ECF subfamily)